MHVELSIDADFAMPPASKELNEEVKAVKVG
jgi:hypothetical protein